MAERIWALAPVVVFDAYMHSLSQPATSSGKFVKDVVPTRSNSRFGKSSNFSTIPTQNKVRSCDEQL